VVESVAAEEADLFDEQKFMLDFRALLAKGDLDEAEKQLASALEGHPDSVRLPLLHSTAYTYFRRANRREEAFRHLDAYVDHQMKAAVQNDRNAESFSRILGTLVDEGSSLGGTERAFAILDDYAQRAKERNGSAEGVLAAIDSQRILQLGKANRVDEAQALLSDRLSAATEALAKSPGDAALILRKAAALKDRLNLESIIGDGDADAAWTELSDFLFTQAKEHPDARAVRQRFETEHLNRAAPLARTDPDAAEALLDRIESVTGEKQAEAADSDSPAARLAILRSPVARLRQQIADARRMLALVGSPAAYPENVDGWVNGAPLTPEALKGKVVLLDFFAVWCGPCIATFPHLRQWHDDYADKGLQIIGVSSYYKYGWNEETGRAERIQDIDPEAERAAMEQFIKHHELRHPVAYVTDRQLQEFYVVNGIPHVVVIDRQGKVRLFRIGSGEANAVAVEEAIKECLAESPPEP
jgi:thiol-disulfide isomerase/thioredoxin